MMLVFLSIQKIKSLLESNESNNSHSVMWQSYYYSISNNIIYHWLTWRAGLYNPFNNCKHTCIFIDTRLKHSSHQFHLVFTLLPSLPPITLLAALTSSYTSIVIHHGQPKSKQHNYVYIYRLWKHAGMSFILYPLILFMLGMIKASQNWDRPFAGPAKNYANVI